MSTTAFTVKVLEHCRVTAPPNTTPKTSSLPLTFLDLPWLFFSTSQPLFCYEFPHSISHFTTTIVPKLKHSLSLTLQHYYPFAGNFVPSHDLTKPQLIFTNNNSVSFTICESDGDFKHLCSNHQRDVTNFHPLVPKLAQSVSCEGKELIPLLAIQVTTFPNAGFSIGLAFHHVVCDRRTFQNFFKTWASYCCCTFEASLPLPLKSLPLYDRSVIIDAKGLHEVFLKDCRKRRLVEENAMGREEAKVDFSSMVRATFLMGASEMEKVKSFIVDCCKQNKNSQPLHLSSYVLTCAFLWVCLVKTQQKSGNEKVVDELDSTSTHFGFIAGGITRLEYPVPQTYLGNCVGFGIAKVRRKELLGEDGVAVAAKAIGTTNKKLDASIFEGAEKWILDWEVLLDGPEGQHVRVTWSPKLKLYDESNFGWGRPKKIEEISIDSTRGTVSLLQSKDVEGGIEIGLSLPKNKMDIFTILFSKGLDVLP